LYRDKALYVFEICPQKETPELAKIAELSFNVHGSLTYSFNGNRVIIYDSEGIVTVWDFIANAMGHWRISGHRSNWHEVC
jgi:hypothetical protein